MTKKYLLTVIPTFLKILLAINKFTLFLDDGSIPEVIINRSSAAVNEADLQALQDGSQTGLAVNHDAEEGSTCADLHTEDGSRIGDLSDEDEAIDDDGR